MAQAAFKKDPDVLCIKFNGWRFQGFEDAKAALIETIITELRDRRGEVGKVIETATDLLKRLDYLKLAKMGLKVGTTLLSQHTQPVLLDLPRLK